MLVAADESRAETMETGIGLPRIPEHVGDGAEHGRPQHGVNEGVCEAHAPISAAGSRSRSTASV